MATSLTTGSPWRVITVFALPLLAGNVVQQLYQFADAVLVGRHLGIDSLAAVGATTSMLFFVLGFAWGLCSGFAIPTAHAFGAGDADGVRRSVTTGTILVGGLSLLLTVTAPLLARPVLTLLRTPVELLDEATAFAQVSFAGIAALMFFNYVAAIIRAIGDSRTPLLFLTFSCLLNVALVAVFIGPLGLGVGGAALATVAAQTTAVLLCMNYIRRRVPALHVRREDWVITRTVLGEHLRLGLPMGFQTSIIAIGSVAVQVRLNELGADAVAAYTTAARVDTLAVAMLQSLGLAVSMFVAQNHGARLYQRIRDGVTQALWLAAVASVLLGATLILAGRTVLEFFYEQEASEVVDLAYLGLSLSASCYIVLGVLFILRGALLGLGQTLIPTLTGVAELLMRVVTAVWLGAAFGYAGVVWGTRLAWAGAVILLVPTYVRARARLNRIPVPVSVDALTPPTGSRNFQAQAGKS